MTLKEKLAAENYFDRDIAHYLGIEVSTLARKRREGDPTIPPSRKLSYRRVVYPKKDFAEWERRQLIQRGRT